MDTISREESVLNEIGLSKNEAKVYLTLLELGTSSAGKVSEKSKVHRTNVYDALQKLGQKGLVQHFFKDETKFFIASDPDNLLNILKQKEITLNRVMPNLNLLKDLSQKQPVSVSIASGMVAVRNSMLRYLVLKKPIFTISSPAMASTISKPFLIQFHKRRISKKIPMYHLFNSDSVERAEELSKMKHTYARILPDNFNATISTGICGDEVALRVWGKDALVITLGSEDVAKAYMAYHKMLWDISREPVL